MASDISSFDSSNAATIIVGRRERKGQRDRERGRDEGDKQQRGSETAIQSMEGKRLLKKDPMPKRWR